MSSHLPSRMLRIARTTSRPVGRVARAGRGDGPLAPLQPVLAPGRRPGADDPRDPPPAAPSRSGRPPRTVAGLMQTVIAAVNARGMCAAQAARVAELPALEVDGIEALCRCAGCLRARAH